MICQGGEGGGHTGLVGTLPLVAQAVERVKIPVIAAGGIHDGRGLAAALALGAVGVWVGTRFIASAEAHAAPLYQEAILGAADEDTVRTRCYSGKPMRVRRNAYVDDWESRPGEIQPFPMQAGISIHNGVMGGIGGQLEGLDPERSCFAMGQSAGGVADVRPAGDIVTRLRRRGGERARPRRLLPPCRRPGDRRMTILARPEGPTANDLAPSRRALAGLVLAGYAAAGLSAAAEPIVTDAAGLVTGMVHFPSGGFSLPAYVARPAAGGRRPAILVVSEVFGLHAYIEDVCRRLAKLGYVALAPAFFVRVADPSPLTDLKAVVDIVKQASDSQVMGDIAATLTVPGGAALRPIRAPWR